MNDPEPLDFRTRPLVGGQRRSPISRQALFVLGVVLGLLIGLLS